jgi:hypothetical protein
VVEVDPIFYAMKPPSNSLDGWLDLLLAGRARIRIQIDPECPVLIASGFCFIKSASNTFYNIDHVQSFRWITKDDDDKWRLIFE